MSRPKILLCLDSDPQPSVFDAVVAIDSGADHLLRYGNVQPHQVRDLVHGAMFTRGGDDLKSTAIFLGGSDLDAGEELLRRVRETFLGPVRVSVMFDSNGANTTAAAAVLAAGKHVPLSGAVATVLGATGPVGQRVTRLLLREGAKVRVASRDIRRAQALANEITKSIPGAVVAGYASGDAESLTEALDGSQIVISAGAAGVELLPAKIRRDAKSLQVAIDLNAVPPVGIEGVEPQDKAAQRDGQVCFGAIGVGGLKMKIHKAAIGSLFQANDLVLDAEEICALGKSIAG